MEAEVEAGRKAGIFTLVALTDEPHISASTG
jgi:hypothetical protein